MSDARVLTNLTFCLLPSCWSAAAAPASVNTQRTGRREDAARTSRCFDMDKFSDSMKKAGKTLIGKGENPEKARALYATAESKYQEATQAEGPQRKSLFLAAAKGFKDAADRWPDSALEQDALFLSGESYFFADYYPNANKQFEALLKKFPNSRYLDIVEGPPVCDRPVLAEMTTRNTRGRCWWPMLTDRSRPVFDDFGHAVRIYDRIRIDDPTGKLADDATLAAANAYFSVRRVHGRGQFLHRPAQDVPQQRTPVRGATTWD